MGPEPRFGFGEPPEGYIWAPVPEGDDWSASPQSTGRCHRCQQPAVMSLNRGVRYYKKGTTEDRWYDYCAQHSYGRVVLEIEPGWSIVVGWHLIPAIGVKDDQREIKRLLDQLRDQVQIGGKDA